jgi:hypothetical protein
MRTTTATTATNTNADTTTCNQVEEFGLGLEQLVYIDSTGTLGRLDMCECERLLKCPNGTASVPGATDMSG